MTYSLNMLHHEVYNNLLKWIWNGLEGKKKAVIIPRFFFPGTSSSTKVGGRAKRTYHLQDLGSYGYV